jgi:glutamyl-tRNA(Gln) amidotransferase subunit D
MDLNELSGIKARVYLKNGKVWEGVILKRYDFANQDYLTLKLDSGYNISIKKEEIEKIEKESVISFNLPRIEVEENPNLKNVLVVSTGGTIASRVDYTTGAVKPILTPENFLVYFPQLLGKANFYFDNPFSKFSEEMTPKDWVKIAERIFNKLQEKEFEGVILTHGTDTLHYTASALSFMIEGNKPIALTAAQRSSDRASTDAIINVLSSVEYVLNNFGEVAIVMHKNLNDDETFAIRGVKARKMHSSRRDTFRPINDLPIAEFKIDLVSKKIEKIKKIKVLKEKGEVKDLKPFIEEKVALIKYYPGFPSEIIDLLIDKNYKGIIIEGTGFGHVNANDEKLINALKRANEEGIYLGMTTQTIYGETNPFVYSTARKLVKIGVNYLFDMIPETAFIKLSWLLGQEKEGEELKKLMLKNFAGEINKEVKIKEFLN